MTDKTRLSVAIITKDEADNLPDCLRSVEFADQVVIVDSGSKDDTLKIAAGFGCDVYREGWHGFGPQKQLAIDRCRHDWVLVLDADERIPAETAACIKEVVRNPAGAAGGYSFPRKNYFQGRWIRHAGWWPDRIIRLFLKDRGRMSRAPVHEGVEVDGPVGELDCPIVHLTESNLSKILLKIDRYSTLGAEEAFAAGKKATIWSASARAGFTFFQDYFLRLGMLDGFQGLTLAVTDTVNKFFKYAKLAEMNRQLKKKQ